MSKKFSIRSFASLSMLGALNGIQSQDNNYIKSTPIKIKTNKEKALEKGLKEWNINGKIVYAATKKAAIKKAQEN